MIFKQHDYIHYVLLVSFILIYVAFDIYNLFLAILFFQLERAYDQIILPLENFRKEHIGGVKVDIFCFYLSYFLIISISDTWKRRMHALTRTCLQFLYLLFTSQDGKKKFEKQTIKFCQSQERYLNLSTKKQDNVLQEVYAKIIICLIYIHIYIYDVCVT